MMLCPPSGVTSKVRVSEWLPMAIRISTCRSTRERRRLFTSLTVSGLRLFVTSACCSTNLGCIKFPMAPESTMAVVLIVSTKVIRAVRCLTNWYGVTAETNTVFSEDKSELQNEAESNTFPSVGATGSVGQSSFLTLHESGQCPMVDRQWLAPLLRSASWTFVGSSGGCDPFLRSQNTFLQSGIGVDQTLRDVCQFVQTRP